MATAYALILNNNDNTHSMVFTKSNTTISVGSTYSSTHFGALPIAAAYTGFETSDYTDAQTAPWATYASTVKQVAVESEIKPISIAFWFRNFTNCTSIDLTLLNTENVTSMVAAFSNDAKLTTIIGVEGWNTSKVTTFKSAFYGCTGLQTLNVSNWDMSSAENLRTVFYNCSSLTSLDVSRWDTSKVTTLESTFRGCSSLATLDVSNWDTSKVENMRTLFCLCTSLTELDVSNWDVSNVQNFISTFSGNSYVGDMKIAKLDVSKWDTSSATNMDTMFYGCGQITELDLRNWDVSNVTSMNHMFADCFKLKDIKFGVWDTSNTTILDAIFNSCMSLETVDVSSWNTSSCQAFSQMFDGCTKLKEIIGLTNFNTSNGITFEEMFNGCSSLVTLDLSSFDTRNATDNTYLHVDHYHNAFTRMFSSMNALQWIRLGANFNFTGSGSAEPFEMPAPKINGNDGHWYTSAGIAYLPSEVPSSTANIYYAVRPAIDDDDNTGEAYALILNNGNGTHSMAFTRSEAPISVGSNYASINYGTLPVVAVYTGFETADYTADKKGPWDAYKDTVVRIAVERTIQPLSMAYWFYKFVNCTSMDMTRVDTSNTTTIQTTFAYCSSLANIDSIINWNTSKLKIMNGAFYSCTSLAELNLSNWDVSAVESIRSLFYNCISLTALDLANWNTKSMTDMRFAFQQCTALKSLNIATWNTRAATTMRNMFNTCTAIVSLDIAHWDVSNVTDIGYMFRDCTALKNIYISNWDTSAVKDAKGVFFQCRALKELDLSNWNLALTTDMSGMFYGCSSLMTIGNISDWGVKSVTTLDSAFYQCPKLQALEFSKWNTSTCKNYTNMLTGCTSLIKLAFGANFSFNGNSTSTSLVIPAPAVAGNDGNWYTADGVMYIASAIPSKTANIYYAIPVNNSISIFQGFERMWKHITVALNNKSNVSHSHDDKYMPKDEAKKYIDNQIKGEW